MASDDSIYQPPESSVDVPTDRVGQFGSVERGLSGDFEFSVGDTLSEAWDLTTGSKRFLLSGLACVYGITLFFSGVSMAITGFAPGEFDLGRQATAYLVQTVGGFLGYPIWAGIFFFAIKRASNDSSASFRDVFGCFDRFFPILGLMVLQGILVLFGFLALLLPGLYLLVAYSLALPLMIEKDMGIWEALETSRKAVTTCWFRCWGLMIVAGLLVGVIGVFTLGIGLIWFGPLAVLSFGVFYRNVFGYEGAQA